MTYWKPQNVSARELSQPQIIATLKPQGRLPVSVAGAKAGAPPTARRFLPMNQNPPDKTKEHTSKETPHLKFETASTTTSTRSIGWALLVTSVALAGLVIFIGLNQRYWFLPPEEKLMSSWKADLHLIKDSKQAELLKRVKDVRLRANDHSPATEWVEKIRAPIDQNKNGDLLADVFLIHQIEGHRYGVIIQYEFIDTATKNKVGEFARTLWLGIYY